jgi:hypothetical protein
MPAAAADASSSPLPVEAATQVLLPTENVIRDVRGQGWSIKTLVGPSNIPGAGNGRFACEKVSKGTIVQRKLMVPMKKIETLVGLPAHTTVTFADVDDMEKYVSLNMTEGGHSREAVLSVFEHFVWSLDGERACLNTSVWCTNHAHTVEGGMNLVFFEPPDTGELVGEAIVDLNEGDELAINYKDFVQPDFFLRYCSSHGFKDPRTTVMEAIGDA